MIFAHLSFTEEAFIVPLLFFRDSAMHVLCIEHTNVKESNVASSGNDILMSFYKI